MPEPLPKPHQLRTNGCERVFSIGWDSPILSWNPDRRQRAAQVVVIGPKKTVVWDSGVLDMTVAEMRSGAELASRTLYRWRARIIDGDGETSPWSEDASFETGLLDPDDWDAEWIGRRTPTGNRIIRSMTWNRIDWIDPGSSLEQSFSSDGFITAVSADLEAGAGEYVVGNLELFSADGKVIGERKLVRAQFSWDRFGRFLALNEPAPPGEYVVRVTSQMGKIGWRTGAHETSAYDDGVSPLPVVGEARRDGAAVPGVRTLGIDTVPAPNPTFRTSFTVPDDAKAARLYATGLGYGVFSINGVRVTDDVLEPAPTQVDQTVLYRAYDVTGLLGSGTNTLTVELGRGFAATRGASMWAWHLAPWNREPTAIAQLEIVDAAGERHTIATDDTWEAAPGPVEQDLLYVGERVRAVPLISEWKPAAVVRSPGGVLRSAELPPTRTFVPITPEAKHTDGDATIFDFGVILAGHVRMTVSGNKDAEIVVRYGETLSPGGAVVCENPLVAGEPQSDVIVFDGSIMPVPWEADFSYNGFRYVSVELRGSSALHDIAAVPVHTDVRAVGTFECDNEFASWIDAATARTFLNNLHGLPTDTPVYEKNGWTADAHLGAEAVLHNFDLRSTFVKWLDDHVDALSEDGVVPSIVPTPDWGRTPDPGWGASLPLIAWNLYWEYGDRAILEKYVDAICRYTDRMLELAPSGIWPSPSYGDWLAPGHQFAPEGPAPAATMMLHRIATRAAEICAVLGMDACSAGYRDSAGRIATAYHEAFFDAASQSYGVPGVGYRQSMNVLPLAFGAVPSDLVGAVGASLIDDIVNRTAGHLDCGAIGVKYLLPVLSELGRNDLAMTVISQETRPGWGAWVRDGERTLLEAWDADARSHNHYFLGSSAAWVQQAIGGLQATSAGWASFDVRPINDPRVTTSRISHETVRGTIAVQWTRTNNEWDLAVDVPAGAIASIHLGGEVRNLATGSHRVTFER